MRKCRRPTLTPWVIALLIVFSVRANAEQAGDIGDAVVYYNAVTTDFFDPQVARAYGITRSKNRGLLTVSVLKKHMGLASQPAHAKVDATAVNLSNQVKSIDMREISEGGAIYYIADFPVSHDETLDFTITVQLEDDEPRVIEYRKTFVTN